MPVLKRLPATLLTLAVTFALSIAFILTAGGGGSTAYAWSGVGSSETLRATSGDYSTQGMGAIGNVAGARYSWSEDAASNAAGGTTVQLSELQEFRPATETWSWVSGGSARDEVYVAAMPELSTTPSAWSWVSGDHPMGTSFAAATRVPGARCVDWIERGGNLSPSCGDDLEAGLNDLWRTGP